MMSSIIVPRARLLHWVITDGICYVSVVSSVQLYRRSRSYE